MPLFVFLFLSLLLTQTSTTTTKYLLYDSKPGEGFNLQLHVLSRTVRTISKLNEASEGTEWVLVLPPWCNMVHWSPSDSNIKFTWSTLFDIDALKANVPTLEFEEFDALEAGKCKNGQDGTCVDKVIHMESNYRNLNGPNFMEEVDCYKDLTHQYLQFQSTGDAWVGPLGNGCVQVHTRNLSCMHIYGSADTLTSQLLREESSATTFLVKNCDQLTHGPEYMDDTNFWTWRASVQFSKQIQNYVSGFINAYLSTDGKRSFISTHLRRQDFVRVAHPEDVPPLDLAAKTLEDKRKQLGVDYVFVATDDRNTVGSALSKTVKGLVMMDEDKTGFNKWHSPELAILEQYIAAQSSFFVGTKHSYYSNTIEQERYLFGFPAKYTQEFCGKEDGQPGQLCDIPSFHKDPPPDIVEKRNQQLETSDVVSQSTSTSSKKKKSKKSKLKSTAADSGPVGNRRHILYTVKPGEGFNLQRQVMGRLRKLVETLQSQQSSYTFVLVVPPWCNLVHWNTNDGTVPYKWKDFFDMQVMSQLFEVMEFEQYLAEVGEGSMYVQHKGIVDLILNIESDYTDINTKAVNDAACGSMSVAGSFEEITDGNAGYKYTGPYANWCFKMLSKELQCKKVNQDGEGLGNWMSHNVDFSRTGSVYITNGDHLGYGNEYFDSDNWWAWRDHMFFARNLREYGDSVIQKYLITDTSRTYVSAHLRRNDFADYAHIETVPKSVETAIARLDFLRKKHNVDKVFVCTDDKPAVLATNTPWIIVLDESIDGQTKFKSPELAIIEQYIASNAIQFIGTEYSVYTQVITEERDLLGYPREATYLEFCGSDVTDPSKDCKGDSFHPAPPTSPIRTLLATKWKERGEGTEPMGQQQPDNSQTEQTTEVVHHEHEQDQDQQPITEQQEDVGYIPKAGEKLPAGFDDEPGGVPVMTAEEVHADEDVAPAHVPHAPQPEVDIHERLPDDEPLPDIAELLYGDPNTPEGSSLYWDKLVAQQTARWQNTPQVEPLGEAVKVDYTAGYLVYSTSSNTSSIGFTSRIRSMYNIVTAASRVSHSWKVVLPQFCNLPQWTGDEAFQPMSWDRFFELNVLKRYYRVVDQAEWDKKEVDVVVHESPAHLTCDDIGSKEHVTVGWYNSWCQPMNAALSVCVETALDTRQWLVDNLNDEQYSTVLVGGPENWGFENEVIEHEWWYWRDAILWRASLRAIGDAVITHMLGGHLSYISAHIRRRDFKIKYSDRLPTLDSIANRLKHLRMISKVDVVYILTDASTSERSELQQKAPFATLISIAELNRFASEVRHESSEEATELHSGEIAIIEQYIATQSRYFIGTRKSTFSQYIMEERDLLGFPRVYTYNAFCEKGKSGNPQQNCRIKPRQDPPSEEQSRNHRWADFCQRHPDGLSVTGCRRFIFDQRN